MAETQKMVECIERLQPPVEIQSSENPDREVRAQKESAAGDADKKVTCNGTVPTELDETEELPTLEKLDRPAKFEIQGDTYHSINSQQLTIDS